MEFLDYFLVALSLAGIPVILYFSKLKNDTVSGYFTASGNLSWFVAGTALVATTFAADTPLAVTELTREHGISGNWLWWSLAISNLTTAFLFAPLWKKSGVVTDLEFLQIRYGTSKAVTLLRKFRAVYLGFFLNVWVLAWVHLALAMVFQVLFPEWNQVYLVGGVALIGILYTLTAGLKGISNVDVYQFLLAIGSCVILAFFAVQHPNIGGLTGLVAKLPKEKLDFFGFLNPNSKLSFTNILTLVTITWWASWYPGSEPGGGGYVAQRLIASKTDTDAMRSGLWFTFCHFFVRPWPWILVALVSIVLHPSLKENGKGFLLVMQDAMPVGVRGILVAMFLAAYLSTLATHLNWGSSYLTYDLVLSGKKDNNQNFRFYNFLFQTLIILVSLYFAFSFLNSVSSAWVFLLQASSGVGFVLMLRWFWPRLNVWSEIGGFLFPFFYFILWKYVLQLEETFILPCTAFATIASVIGLTYWTKPTDDAVLVEFANRTSSPGLLWKQFLQKRNLPFQPLFSIPKRILLILVSIVMLYSLLFSLGYLLFGNFFGFYSFGIFLVFSVLFVFVSRKSI